MSTQPLFAQPTQQIFTQPMAQPILAPAIAAAVAPNTSSMLFPAQISTFVMEDCHWGAIIIFIVALIAGISGLFSWVKSGDITTGWESAKTWGTYTLILLTILAAVGYGYKNMMYPKIGGNRYY